MQVRLDKADSLVLAEARGAWEGEGSGIGPFDASLAPEWFHRGQVEAWERHEQVLLVLAGTQSGKTVFGPWWLLREIQRRGAGDYAVVGPEFSLLSKKAVPEFLKVFRTELGLGRYVGSPIPRFEFSEEGLRRLFGSDAEPCTVFFGYARKPETLESSTYKAVWCDESGQPDFKRGSYEALNRRLAIHQGRQLHTTTPYELGWLKEEIFDRAGEPGFAVVGFTSLDNPAFPRERWEEAQASLDPWKFDLFYRARFTKPAGAIYDCFEPSIHVVDRFEIPRDWPCYVGLDFGGVNTAAVFLAEDPSTSVLYVFDSYHLGKPREIEDHVRAIKERLRSSGVFCCGGSHQEGGWRKAFSLCGLPVAEPGVSDVQVGIESVYAQLRLRRLFVFRGLDRLIHEFQSYSRELDSDGAPVDDAIRDKAKFHRLDALRYIVSHLRGQGALGIRRTLRVSRRR